MRYGPLHHHPAPPRHGPAPRVQQPAAESKGTVDSVTKWADTIGKVAGAAQIVYQVGKAAAPYVAAAMA